MEISLIISGNLTGFSRFYTSPNANDVYNEAKFDFDYRNFLTFLNAGEKAYAISFSPKIIAVSLITRILDSFRRPGILVVTALIPRYQLVRGQLNQTDKTAIFKLLNEVNDKFYEKNFLNGMVNQNPAVLMQDYYSDILSRYVFVNDRMQKPVNSRIDVTSPNKRIGYVAATESSMPLYLSSVMRKSYEGYHHVFLSPHAPQNIDEPAEEIITYKVRIENGNRPVPGEVRLTDRIPNINPEQGEKDIPNKNFTYGQVISGEAGTDIIGTIENGETIVLNYRFPQEEKTVYFKFYDGATEVPVHIIRPEIVEYNGTHYPLSTNSWPFRGKEIYGHKNLKSGNNEYTIDNPSLDLSRVRNDETINIYVHRGWNLEYNFGNINKPKTIILTNRFSRERKVIDNITTTFVERGISGKQSDWDVEIQSDYYETVRIPATQSKFTIYPKKEKPISQVSQVSQTDGGRNISTHQGGQQRTTTGGTDQGLKISKGDQHTAKDSGQIRREKNKRYMTYGVAVIAACLLVFGGIWVYNALFGNDKQDVITPRDDWQEMDVTFSVNGYDGKAIESENLLSELEVAITSNVVEIDNGSNDWSKKLSYPLKDDAILSIKISLKDHSDSVQFLSKDINYTEFSENIPLQLSINEGELKTYAELKNMERPTNNVGEQLKSLASGSRRQMEFAKLLNSLSRQYLDHQAREDEEKRIAAEEARKAEEAARKAAAKEDHSNGTDKIRDGFNALHLLLSPDKSSLMSDGQKLKPQNKAEEDRNEALINVLTQLNGGAVPPTTPRALSSQQKKIINDLRHFAQGLDNGGKAKLRSDLKRWKSLSQIQANIISKK